MSKKANPLLVGWFATGGLVIVIIGLLILGGGEIFEQKFPCVAYFEESISGLDIGAPVDFKGVRVGTVTDVQIVIDRDKREIKRPVTFVLEPARIRFVGGDATIDRDGVINSVRTGLKVMLAKQSLLTGKLKLELYFSDSETNSTVEKKDGIVEVPSVLSPMAAAKKTIEEVDIPSIFTDIKTITGSLSNIATNDDLKHIISELNATMGELHKLTQNANANIKPLGSNLIALTESLQLSITNINNTIGGIKERIPLMSSNLLSLATSTQEGVQNANKFIGDLSQQLIPLMQESTLAISNINAKVDARSDFSIELKTLLENINKTTKSIGEMVNYIERHPESMMRGKK